MADHEGPEDERLVYVVTGEQLPDELAQVTRDRKPIGTAAVRWLAS